MKTVKYYNPKNNRYITAKIEKIEGDTLFMLSKIGNFENRYKESLKNLKELSKKDNPDWNGTIKKPLVIIT